jgi:competence protein ComEA
MMKRFILAIIVAFTPLLLAPLVHAEEMAVAGQAQSVNINSADAETLAHNLVGVGLSRAQEIVRYREAYGPFYSVEDLMEVRGIGRSTLEKNRDRITLE